jgi:hypothetical protein
MITRRERKGRYWLRWLLILPFIVLMWPAFYSSGGPTLFDFPFFYWFQLLWIIITAIITAVVYFAGA